MADSPLPGPPPSSGEGEQKPPPSSGEGEKKLPPQRGEGVWAAPAKINLALEVLGRRADGYHEVRTVLQAIDLADELRVSAHGDGGTGVELRVEPPGSAPVEGNLVLDAARLLGADALPGASIALTKRIPAAAGLGGGSSDAAAALLALRRFHDLPMSDDDLAALAARLGSDVPFFLSGGTALGTGRGEQLSPLPPPVDRFAVVAWPDAPEPENKTARMYRLLRPEHYTDGAATEEVARRLREGVSLDGALYNVFDTVAGEAHDGYEAMRERFVEAGARQPTLCGSGPAMFALAQDEAEGAAMAGRMESVGYRARLTRMGDFV